MLQRRLVRAVLLQETVTRTASPPTGAGPRVLRAPGTPRGPLRLCLLRGKLGLQGVLLTHETHRRAVNGPLTRSRSRRHVRYRMLSSTFCLATTSHVPGRAAPELWRPGLNRVRPACELVGLTSKHLRVRVCREQDRQRFGWWHMQRTELGLRSVARSAPRAYEAATST